MKMSDCTVINLEMYLYETESSCRIVHSLGSLIFFSHEC